MPTKPTLRQYSLDDFVGMCSSQSSYVPESNVDVFVHEGVSTRSLNRRDKMVDAFLVKMHAQHPDLVNFRVVYPVDQGCGFCFWSPPSMVKLHQKVPTAPGSQSQFSIAFMVEAAYLKSVIVVRPERVVDYGTSSIGAVK